MRNFNYSKIKDKKWDSEILSLVASIYKYQGKQELYLKQRYTVGVPCFAARSKTSR